MIKFSLSEANLAPFAVIGLILFVAIFTSIAVWALTRRQKQISRWSSLPLADGYEPVELRHTKAGSDPDVVANQSRPT